MLDAQAVCLESIGDRSPVESRQMSRGKRMDFQTVKLERGLGFPRDKENFERNDIRSEVARMQPLFEGLGEFCRQKNVQLFCSASQPCSLNKHWQSSRMVRMAMRKEKCV